MESWREELYHHGIKGQKWGVQNGPPYPLTPEQKRENYHALAEKSYQKSVKIKYRNHRPIERTVKRRSKRFEKEAAGLKAKDPETIANIQRLSKSMDDAWSRVMDDAVNGTIKPVEEWLTAEDPENVKYWVREGIQFSGPESPAAKHYNQYDSVKAYHKAAKEFETAYHDYIEKTIGSEPYGGTWRDENGESKAYARGRGYLEAVLDLSIR